MNIRKFSFIALLIPFLVQGQEVQKSSLVASGAKLTTISQEFSFTEGPTPDRKGNVYFTDQPNDRIWKYTFGKGLDLFKEGTGRANGLFIDRQGNLLACADLNNQLWKIDMEGNVDTLLSTYRDSVFNGPNDLWISPNGHLYFTDPYYQRPYWTRQKPDLTVEAVYRLDPNGELHREDADFKRPNGIVGTADGNWLYVADIDAHKTYRYKILPDGRLSDKTLFHERGSDGMTLDEKGNLYLTGREGVSIIDPNGKLIEIIPIPEGWTANVCFSGPNLSTLFITAMKSIYTIEMKVKGIKGY